jgi:hypothetical protein
VEQRCEPAADFARLMEHERAISPSLDGRSVSPRQQMSLFDLS